MSITTTEWGIPAVHDPEFGETESGETEFSDEELTALALAADPDQLPDVDAVPLSLYPGRPSGGLPEWYMPPVVVRGWRGWRLPVVFAVIAGFLLIDALGLCITYGQLIAA
jgi:hypothetical protein